MQDRKIREQMRERSFCYRTRLKPQTVADKLSQQGLYPSHVDISQLHTQGFFTLDYRNGAQGGHALSIAVYAGLPSHCYLQFLRGFEDRNRTMAGSLKNSLKLREVP